MVTGTKTISLLLVALIATWLPIGQCCLTMACATEPVEASEPVEAVPASSEGCRACPVSQSTPTPAEAPEPDSSCDCTDLAATPDPDRLTRLATSGSHLLAALNLWTPLPDVHRFADPQTRAADRDIGPSLAAQRSLLAQSCLLIV